MAWFVQYSLPTLRLISAIEYQSSSPVLRNVEGAKKKYLVIQELTEEEFQRNNLKELIRKYGVKDAGK